MFMPTHVHANGCEISNEKWHGVLVAVTRSFSELDVASAGVYAAITPAATALRVVKRNWRRFGFGNSGGRPFFDIDLPSLRRKRGSVSPIEAWFSSRSGSTTEVCNSAPSQLLFGSTNQVVGFKPELFL